jgi:nitronate monooxygenase
VREACKAGLVGGLPRQNARSFAEFDAWLGGIRVELDRHAGDTGKPAGPLAVNLATRVPEEELGMHFDLCARHGVKIVITVGGDPTALIRRAHDAGLLVFHDITSLRFAEKAIAAGADGLNCIGAGGGGHSGTVSHLALIRKVRSIYRGVIVMGGAVSDGATIRAAELLGADLAYMGTRFIATQESMAPDAYKAMLVSQRSSDLIYTDGIAGVPANWLVQSIRMAGLDPDNLPRPIGRGMRHDHLPPGAEPWKNVWSAGHGIDLIDDVPTVRDLVLRLRAEYVEACRTPDMAQAAAG